MEFPRFDKPPVVEVALAVQFDAVRGLRTPLIAEYWETIRRDFPEWTEAAALAPILERFGTPPGSGRGFKIQFHDEAPPIRALFESSLRDRLIQVQSDRFVTNWRKGGDPYPRYDSAIRGEFQSAFEHFREFLRSRGHECQPNQWEVTYVNFIKGDGWDPRAQLGRVLKCCSTEVAGGSLGAPEWVDYAAHFAIRDSNTPVGRLHVTAGPAVDANGAAVLRVALTARGYPKDPTTDSVMDGLDLGRRHVVESFAALTTHEMHELWEKR